MTPERWQEVQRVFQEALDQPDNLRSGFVAHECNGDDTIRREVDSLLAASSGARQFLEVPALPTVARLVAAGAAARHAGDLVGPYQLAEHVGSGGMGEVWRSHDTRLNRNVALKFSATEFEERFVAEARAIAALNHPNICQLYDVGPDYLVMEFVEGESPAGPMPLATALSYAQQIADALDAAHQRGIVHRDLKPANIKLTAGGAVKILDFGVATAVGPGDHGAMRDALIAGTPAYMSPEQARGERVDQRCDIWAFGCVLYEMLAGHRAFRGATVSETIAAVLEHEIDWALLPPAMPDGIRRLLRRCLEKDPKRRLHHIADARIEIEDASRAAVDGPPDTSRRSRRPQPVFWAAALALALTLGLLFLRSAPEAPVQIVDIATSWTSDPLSFALSPDGRRLAFVGDYQGQPTIWVRSLDAAEAQPLPGTQGARRPFWSPDSRSIGFFAFTELKRIDARGGAPQTVTSILAGFAAAWGDEGNILFSGIMPRTVSPSPSGLLRVHAVGGAVGTATRPTPQSTGHRFPQFLPGGREFLYFVGGASDVRGLYVGSLDSSESTRLVASDSQGAYLAPGWLLFARQGALLAQRFDVARRKVSGEPFMVADSVAFDPITGGAAISTADNGVFAYRSGRAPVTQLAWFDRSGRTLATIGPSQETGLSNPALSPDGRRVVAERTGQNGTALWLLDFTRQFQFATAKNERMARWPVWSPVGDRIAFASVRTGSTILSTRPTVGEGGEEVLLEYSTEVLPSDWSQDGRFLMYFAPDPSTGTDLWVLPQDTHVPKVFLATPANEMWGQFSPDGRWIAYQSNETGRFEVYVRPFPGPGVPLPISTAGGVYVRWSHDGNELYYVAPDATMMAVPVRHKAAILSAGEPVALFKTRRVGGGVNVIRSGHQYGVARDGRFLINVETESSPRPVTLVMNWRPSTR